MNTLYFGGPVDGGTFPAAIWSEYMSHARGKYCGSFPLPKVPFLSQPFYGKYASSGGAAIGGPELTTPDTTTTTPVAPTTPAEPTPDAATAPQTQTQTQPQTQAQTQAPTPADPSTPSSGGFDPSQYQSPAGTAPSNGQGTPP